MIHEIKHARVDKRHLLASIDGKECSFDLDSASPRLAKASEIELQLFEVLPSGYGIHWPVADEDLSIDGLLGIRHSPPGRISRTKSA